MRCSDERSGELFSYVHIEERVSNNLPLRLIRRIINEVLAELESDFAKLHADDEHPSIAPAQLGGTVLSAQTMENHRLVGFPHNPLR